MAGKKISPKVQLAAEEFLASIGSSREQLTERQWEAVARAVKGLKTAKIAIAALLVFGAVCAGLSFWGFSLGSRMITSAVPEGTKEIVFISEAGEESRPESADYMKCYIRAAARISWQHGTQLGLAAAFCYTAIIGAMSRRDKRKLLQALLAHAG